MPLLIEDLSVCLTSNVIELCKIVGIRTVTDFVTKNTEELSQKTNVPYKDLVCIRHNLLSTYGAFPQRADSLYSMLLETMYIVGSGSKRINTFLKGGIYAGEVTELHGSPGSGKTQFCLSIAANLVSDSENTALYLDSNCNFSAKRMEQILTRKCENETAIADKMHKVKVVKVRDIYHLFDILDNIISELNNMRLNIYKYCLMQMFDLVEKLIIAHCEVLPRSSCYQIEKEEFFKHLKFIVIDSITNLLSPCFGGKYLDGPGFIGNVTNLFKIICSDHMVSILVINNTVQSDGCDIKAGLGASWKYVPSVSLCIRKLNENKLYKLTAVKSCRNDLHNEATFRISEAGISD